MKVSKHFGAGVLVAMALLAAGPALSQGDASVYSEQHRKVRGSSNVDALGPNLFGDQVSLYSGRVEFVQHDLELPGNNALPMGVARRLTTGRDMVATSGLFGDWDLEIPRLHGIFATSYNNFGWAVGDYAPDYYKRCSQYGSPPIGRPISAGTTIWEPEEYWYGNSLYMPGQGSQMILLRSAANTRQPTDGNAYPLVTKGGWQIGCLPSLANGASSGNLQGEGFFALAPDGTRWTFNHLVERRTTILVKAASGGGGALAASGNTGTAGRAGTPSVRTNGLAVGSLPPEQVTATFNNRLVRAEFWLLPTRATDRFGNTQTYHYDSINPWKLLSIVSNDGRTLSFTHEGSSQRITSAHDGSRTWTYEYAASGSLARVVRPDGSAWRYTNTYAVKNFGVTYYENPSCSSPGGIVNNPQTLTMSHPSGATGEFTVRSVTHGRTDVPQRCSMSGSNYVATIPLYFGDRSLSSKVLSGPGITRSTWNYTYSVPAASWAPCSTGCVPTKTVSVTDPQGVVTRSTFGTRYGVNEGKLLLEEVVAANGVVLRSTSQRYRAPSAGPYPDPAGYNPQQLMDNTEATRHQPLDQRIVTQQGVNFTWQADDFDVHARATRVSRHSSLGYSKSETTAYYDHLGKWVLGQLASIAVSSSTGSMAVAESHDYDATTANRTRSHAFGRLSGRFGHHPDGTLHSSADAVNPATFFTNYWRGVARNVTLPDGNTESAVVNNLGLVTSVTNAAGSTTAYGYDAIGRLASISHPAEPGLNYHATSQVFEQVPTADRGLASGHWRQTISTGNNRKLRYFDALWRERLRYAFDAANEAGTSSSVETRYDIDGRKTFESYPQRSLGSVGTGTVGHAWDYDALGRESAHRQDSELSPSVLSTATEFLGGFRKRVTNPRGYASTFSYQVWDAPREDGLTNIDAPEGVNVAIARDALGKPLTITRSGGGASATRRYVYDAYERLCKTVEPESSATVQGYDAAGNLAWRASGQAFPGAGCETQVAGSTVISYGYDLRNRLLSTSYGDGSQNITRSYTPDGLLSTIGTSGAGVNPIAWAYSYNNRRLLTKERYTWGDPNNGWDFAWGPDAHGHAASLADPWGTVNYAPDALGRATQVSGYASGVSYHPNGALAGYTLGNGVGYVMSQNLRGLPEWMQHGSVVRDRYAYDANGNVTAISDETPGGVNSRSMTLYDGLDRLRQANGPWGAGSFSYDALDNLTGSAVGGRSLTHHIDPGTNRLTGLSGSVNLGIGYDANGNLTQRGGQGFNFDIGNRMTAAAGKASYVYDGHGRRNLVWFAGGGYMHQAYTQEGKLRFAWRSAQGSRRHVYLGDRLIAETTEGGITTYAHTDGLGSPVAKTNSAGSVVERTRYEPYGATVASSTNPATIGFTGHVNDADTGLVYMQQRYYDPIAGRFLSVDPVVTNARNGSFFNRYVYGNNNPYKFKDPDGRAAETPWDAANVAMGAVSLVRNVASGNYVGAAVDAVGIVIDVAATAAPGVPGGAATAIQAVRAADKVGDAAKVAIPKPGMGKGSVPPGDRDPKRLFTREEVAKGLEKQGGDCAGCGKKLDSSEAVGHHTQRHADGGKTASENLTVVCNPCHKEVHKPD